ncbi:MAG: nuclear transport factor 2 family protein [Thermoanaerobaculia bacterium]|jgi:uncharacterized protein (TIGR02246 family)
MRQAITAAMITVAFFATPAYSSALSEADTAAIQARLNKYVTEWLAGNESGVMRQLASDAVMVPGDKKPLVGSEAIRRYWWPLGAPPFHLDRYAMTIDQIAGSGDLAIVRGTQALEWTSGGQRWKTRGNYVTALRRTNDAWLISMLITANALNEKLP